MLGVQIHLEVLHKSKKELLQKLIKSGIGQIV
jgi:hypothetical protein